MDQVFKLLDAEQSNNENETDKLINDFNTEFIAPEKIELTDNPDNVSALTLEVNVHVVDQGTTHTKELQGTAHAKELETNKTRKKQEKSTLITWKLKLSPHS